MAFEGKGDQLKGKAKEAAGNLTGNESLENEGKADNLAGNIKDCLLYTSDAADE